MKANSCNNYVNSIVISRTTELKRNYDHFFILLCVKILYIRNINYLSIIINEMIFHLYILFFNHNDYYSIRIKNIKRKKCQHENIRLFKVARINKIFKSLNWI
jgi:hypothetical protein